MNTYTETTASGGAVFSFTFPYISTSHIEVFLDGEETIAFEVTDTDEVTLDEAPEVGVVVRVSRNSAREDPESVVNFATGRLRSEDMNTAIRQCFYLAQEAYEQASTGALTQIQVLDSDQDEILDRLSTLEGLLGVVEPFFTYTVSTSAPASEDGNNGEFWFEREA